MLLDTSLDFQKLLRVPRAERKLGDGVAGERGNGS